MTESVNIYKPLEMHAINYVYAGKIAKEFLDRQQIWKPTTRDSEHIDISFRFILFYNRHDIILIGVFFKLYYNTKLIYIEDENIIQGLCVYSFKYCNDHLLSKI